MEEKFEKAEKKKEDKKRRQQERDNNLNGLMQSAQALLNLELKRENRVLNGGNNNSGLAKNKDTDDVMLIKDKFDEFEDAEEDDVVFTGEELRVLRDVIFSTKIDQLVKEFRRYQNKANYKHD